MTTAGFECWNGGAPGQQVKGRRRQRVLVGAAVERVRPSAARAPRRTPCRRSCWSPSGRWYRRPSARCRSPPTGFADRWPSGIGEQDVGGLDVAVQQVALVRVVERLGDRGDDLGDLVAPACPSRYASRSRLRRVGAVDVVHRDPQLTVELAAVVHADDVRVPQRRRRCRPRGGTARGTHRRPTPRRAGPSARPGGAVAGVAPGRPRPCRPSRAAARWCSRRTSPPRPTAWANSSRADAHRSRISASSPAARDTQISIIPASRSGSVSSVSRWSTSPGSSTRVAARTAEALLAGVRRVHARALAAPTAASRRRRPGPRRRSRRPTPENSRAVDDGRRGEPLEVQFDVVATDQRRPHGGQHRARARTRTPSCRRGSRRAGRRPSAGRTRRRCGSRCGRRSAPPRRGTAGCRGCGRRRPSTSRRRGARACASIGRIGVMPMPPAMNRNRWAGEP